jgi:hypothetical protein
VVWWCTLHPQSVVLAPEGPALPFAMLAALALSLVAFTLLYTCLVHFRVQIDLTRADIRALRRHAHERVG